jgi:hypothetical protein
MRSSRSVRRPAGTGCIKEDTDTCEWQPFQPLARGRAHLAGHAVHGGSLVREALINLLGSHPTLPGGFDRGKYRYRNHVPNGQYLDAAGERRGLGPAGLRAAHRV